MNISKALSKTDSHWYSRADTTLSMALSDLSERNGMWWNHMPKIFLHWFSKPGWSRTNNHWMRLTTYQCWLVWWSTSPLITVQQDLHHLLSWLCEVLVACWNSHSRTRAWLAFHKICTGWHSMISVVQCPQTMIKSLHHHHHTRWEQLLFISF